MADQQYRTADDELERARAEAEPPPSVRFGKQPYQLLPLPVAEQILCAMSESMPVLFGKLLAEAWIGPEAVKRGSGRPPQ